MYLFSPLSLLPDNLKSLYCFVCMVRIPASANIRETARVCSSQYNTGTLLKCKKKKMHISKMDLNQTFFVQQTDLLFCERLARLMHDERRQIVLQYHCLH